VSAFGAGACSVGRARHSRHWIRLASFSQETNERVIFHKALDPLSVAQAGFLERATTGNPTVGELLAIRRTPCLKTCRRGALRVVAQLFTAGPNTRKRNRLSRVERLIASVGPFDEARPPTRTRMGRRRSGSKMSIGGHRRSSWLDPMG